MQLQQLLLVVLLYKAGETMADSQWKPFLVDSGFSAEEIGRLPLLRWQGRRRQQRGG